MITILIALALIGFFFVFEGRIRQGQAAKSFDRGAADRGSTMIIGMSFGFASIMVVVAALLDYFNFAFFDNAVVAWIGIALMIAGIGMRFWANRTLGEFYTRTLLTTSNQRVVQAGPYRVVRHPGYLGTVMLWIGAGIATANWIALALIASLMLGVYSYRIRSEEAMLQSALGDEYKKYMARTWRLIPLLY